MIGSDIGSSSRLCRALLVRRRAAGGWRWSGGGRRWALAAVVGGHARAVGLPSVLGACAESRPDGGPLGLDDTEVRGVAQRAIGHDHVPAEDALERRTDAGEGVARRL